MSSTKQVEFNKYTFTKWSNNTSYERTERKEKREKERNTDNNIVEQALQENLALNDYNNIQTEFDRLVPDGFSKQNNKREGQNEKLLNRGMMIQKSINPFLNTSNYLEHLDAEENFLRPKDSNF